MIKRRDVLLLVFGAAPLLAQIGFPIPGTRRGGRTPSPFPGGGGRGGGQRKRQSDTHAEEPLASFRGTVKSLDSKKLVLQRPEAEPMEFICSKKTTYYEGSKQIKRSAVKPGSLVSVEARPLIDGKSGAVNIRLEHVTGA